MTTLPDNGSAGDERDGDTQETAADAGSADRSVNATAAEPADLPLGDDGDTLVLDSAEDRPAATADESGGAPAGGPATDGGASAYASAPYRPAPYRPTPYSPAVTPRVRSGAIAWGAIVVLTAVAVLLVQLNPAAASAYASWQASLTLGTIALLGVVAVGALVLLFAVLSAIRRAQRRARGETR